MHTGFSKIYLILKWLYHNSVKSTIFRQNFRKNSIFRVGHVHFTTVALKTFSKWEWMNPWFFFEKIGHFHFWFLFWNDFDILENCVHWKLLLQEKRQYLPHHWSDKCLKGTVVNQACRLNWNHNDSSSSFARNTTTDWFEN